MLVLILAMASFLPAPVDCFSAKPLPPPTVTSTRQVTEEAAAAVVPTTTNVDQSHVPTLEEYQTNVAAPLVSSFEPSTFSPPLLLANPHFQTIVAAFLRQVPQVAYFYTIADTMQGMLSEIGLAAMSTPHKQRRPKFWTSRQRIDTPDGDFFHVDYKLHSQDTENTTTTSSSSTTTTRNEENADTDNNNHEQASLSSSRGMVVMCHGLESNSDSNLSRDMAQAYFNVGLDVACLNFRGCCGNTNDLLGGYHLGFTDDLLLFLKHQLKSSPQSPTTQTQQSPPAIYLSGFSLGANVILKTLGELGMDAITEYNIRGATAFCVPYDAERNAPFLGKPGFNQVVYCNNLLKTLRKRAHYQLQLHCNGDEETDKFDYAGVMAAKIITDFDEAFVARVYGFDNATDYYRKTACIGFLEQIAVPTFILTARDDPFMDPSLLPTELTQEGGGKAPIKMVATDNGGHCGFIFHQVQSRDDIRETSWSSTEMARFFEHLIQKE